ncbi:MAG TPA: Bax inhibitor-1/YccA family protein [Acholeplasma sp.]|nr:Bax inhibitor-1/YccA family protein [Acholeplasma sp.]
MKNSNPVFSKINREKSYDFVGEQATYMGVMSKTLILFALALMSAFGSLMIAGSNPGLYMGLLIGSMITGLIGVFGAIAKPNLSHIFGPIYALSEGVALGIISLVYATAFGDSFGGPGIIGLAIIITMSIFGGMLFVYASRIIRVTSRFRKMVVGVGFGILLTFLFTFIVSFFDGGAMSYTLFGNPNSPLVLFLSLLLIMYGAFTLLLQFDMAERMVEQGMPKRYEWTAGVGLMVAIVYIYYQVLRLLAILASRSRD